MKLLNITNRYYIAIALVLLLVSSAFLAYRVLYVVDNEISEHMLFEKLQIEKQLALQKDLQDVHFIIGDRIEIEPIDTFTSFKVRMTDTTLYDITEKRKIPYRVISYDQLVGGKSYRINLSRRLTGNENLFQGVLGMLLLVAAEIIICFYFLNRWFSSKIWNPFYRALLILKDFDLQKGTSEKFIRSKVDEFNALNAELSKLTDKVSRDYRNLKEFTENMSHETQTPLAIIRSKLELLLQSENLSEEQVQRILDTLDSVNRLSKMNKGLILLTRIENEQYAEHETIQLGELIRKHLRNLELFISSREINVKTDIDDTVTIDMNPHLAEILLTNLLSNAIKYCTPGGILSVALSRERLAIANSGEPLTIPDDQIFGRFKKGNQPDSVGLGLAIVKKISDNTGFRIYYRYAEQMHTFILQL